MNSSPNLSDFKYIYKCICVRACYRFYTHAYIRKYEVLFSIYVSDVIFRYKIFRAGLLSNCFAWKGCVTLPPARIQKTLLIHQCLKLSSM